MHEPQIRHHFQLAHVIATIDAVNGEGHLQRQPESVKQVAVADSIVITKVDLADPAAVDVLEAGLVRLNPSAQRWRSANTPPPAEWMLGANNAPLAAGGDPRIVAEEPAHSGHQHDVNRHDARIRAFTLAFDASIDWNAFSVWLTLLLNSHGSDVLRVKGMLRVVGATGPVVINAVQHLVHPPIHLEAWPDAWTQSQLVFIVRDLVRTDIERSFTAFQSLLSVTNRGD
jgi:G3E family GTPase